MNLSDLSPDVALLALVGLIAVVVIAVLGRSLSIGVGNVHAELKPNGGSSAKDQIARVDRNMLVIAKHLGIADKLESPPEVHG